MRHLCLIVCLVTLVSTTAMAQLVGGPIAGTAADHTPQAMQVAGYAGTVSDGPTFIGGRFSYALNGAMEVFGDVARMSDYLGGDMEGDFSATAVQVGATYNLPVNLPFDLAVRAAVVKPFVDSETIGSESVVARETTASMNVDVSVIGLGVYGIASRDLGELTGINGLSAYVAAGLNWIRTEVEWSWNVTGTDNDDPLQRDDDFNGAKISMRGSGSDSNTETDVGVAAGGIMKFNENLSVFAELGHISDIVATAGAIWNF
jgi:hypothetical protein